MPGGRALMKQFKGGGRCWVKEAHVHSVQLLTFPTDIHVGVFYRHSYEGVAVLKTAATRFLVYRI